MGSDAGNAEISISWQIRIDGFCAFFVSIVHFPNYITSTDSPLLCLYWPTCFGSYWTVYKSRHTAKQPHLFLQFTCWLEWLDCISTQHISFWFCIVLLWTVSTRPISHAGAELHELLRWLQPFICLESSVPFFLCFFPLLSLSRTIDAKDVLLD